MGKKFDFITETLAEWIQQQHMFFVATAPLSAEGHVNLSPKGQDSFRVLSPLKVAYLDLTGSGNETSAHLLENQRITFMFCAFDTPPQVLRLFGKGHVVLPDSPKWEELSDLFPNYLGTRQIIVAEIEDVRTACGYAIPLMDYVGERDTLTRWAEAKGPDGLVEYRQQKNQCSLDDLPTHIGKAEQATQE
jgi:hypothetical protein